MPQGGRTPASDAYGLHERFWADSGGDIRLPIDPFDIAYAMGVTVYTTVMGGQDSGFLAEGNDGAPAIYLNEAHHERRQRFTCAHELGHLVDLQNRGVPIKTRWRDERSAHGTDAEEIYANRFAAALLMPRSEVKRLLDAGLSQAELARRFGVSDQAMGWRLTNLGLR